MRKGLFLAAVFGILLVPYCLGKHFGAVSGTIFAVIWSLGFIGTGLSDWLQRVFVGTESPLGAEHLPLYMLYLFALGVTILMSHFLGLRGSVLIIALVTTWFVHKTTY